MAPAIPDDVARAVAIETLPVGGEGVEGGGRSAQDDQFERMNRNTADVDTLI